MVIPEAKADLVRDFILAVETQDFSEDTLPQVTPMLNDILDGNYLALMFLPNRFSPCYHLLSNNPPEFLDVYLPLMEKEFLIRHLVDYQEITLLHRLATPEMRRFDEFCVEVQRVRPVSDVCYVPLRLDGYLSGYFATGRAGLNSPIYTRNDIQIFEWLSGFLTESFRKSLTFPACDDSTALINGKGEVVVAGERIGRVFKELLDEKESRLLSGGRSENRIRMRRWCAAALSRHTSPGDLILTDKQRIFRFGYRRLPQSDFRAVNPNYPQISIRLDPDASRGLLIDVEEFGRRFELTKREIQVIDGIYRGLSNAEIGDSLGTAEATVKRQLSSIYTKCRVKNRMELVFAIAG